MLEKNFSEVEEYIESTVKEGKLAQLAACTRNLAEHVVSLGIGKNRPNVSDLSDRIIQLLDLRPADTVSVYSRSLPDSQMDITSESAKRQVEEFLEKIGKAGLTGEYAAQWRKIIARNTASLRGS